MSTEAGELVVSGVEFSGEDRAGPLGHSVITTGEDIHGGIAGFGPCVDGDVGFGQECEPCDALWIETMGDEVEESGTSTLGCRGDGVSQKSFVIELGLIAVVELEDAVFPNRFGDLVGEVGLRSLKRSGLGGSFGGEISGPSRVRVERGKGLGHQGTDELASRIGLFA